MAPVLCIPKVLLLFQYLVKSNPAATARYVITLLLEDTDGKEKKIPFLNITFIGKPNAFSRYRLAIA